MKPAFDSFDVALLNLLQLDNQATAETMSGQIGLSPSAVTRRLRRLRATGLIATEAAQVTERLLACHLQATINIQLREHAEAAAVSSFRKLLIDEPAIQICFEISGTFDLQLVTVTRDMAAFTAFADRVLGSSPVVQRYETAFVKRIWKRKTHVKVDLQDLLALDSPTGA